MLARRRGAKVSYVPCKCPASRCRSSCRQSSGRTSSGRRDRVRRNLSNRSSGRRDWNSAISTRGAYVCVRKIPTGLPDWTRQGFVIFQRAQRGNDRVIAMPIAGAASAAASIHNQVFPASRRLFRDRGCSSTCARRLPAASPCMEEQRWRGARTGLVALQASSVANFDIRVSLPVILAQTDGRDEERNAALTENVGIYREG